MRGGRTLKGLTAAAVVAALAGTTGGGCADKTGFPPAPGTAGVAAHYEAPGTDDARTLEIEQAYHDLLASHTQHVRGSADYFDTPVTYDVAYLSWPLANAELKARGMRRLWSAAQFEAERESVIALHRKNFVFRIALYVEKLGENRLGAGEAAPWKAFLVIGGERIAPARIRQIAGENTELAWLFPELDRFEKLYEIEFTRPQGGIPEGVPARLEITGFPDTTYSEWYLSRDPGAPPAKAEAPSPAETKPVP